MAQHVTGKPPLSHPFDPLTAIEIELAVAVVRKEYGDLYYNAVTLFEPRKEEMLLWLADPDHSARPRKVADIVAIGKGSKVYDGLVDLDQERIIKWELVEGAQPLVRVLRHLVLI